MLRVFKNRVLGKIFGSKGDEIIWDWRKLNNIKLNNLYFSPNIIRVIKLKRMTWAGHVAGMGRIEVHRGFWLRKLRERDHLEYLVVDGRIILKFIVKN